MEIKFKWLDWFKHSFTCFRAPCVKNYDMTCTSILLILTPSCFDETVEVYKCQTVLLCVKLYVKRMWDEDGSGGFQNHIEIQSGFGKSNHFRWTYLDFVCFEEEVNNLWDYALEIKCKKRKMLLIYFSLFDVWNRCDSMSLFIPVYFFLFHYLPADSLHSLMM